MIVENGPLNFPLAALDTLGRGVTFEVPGYSQGSEFMVLGGAESPSAVGRVAVVRLRDGEVMLLNHDSNVTVRPFKCVPVG